MENWGPATDEEKLMAKLMRVAVNDKTTAVPTKNDLAQLRSDTISKSLRLDFNYFLGEIFAMSGRDDEARACWQMAVDQGPFQRDTCTLAGFRLHQTTESSSDETKGR